MDDQPASRRPIGWWLKEADALLDGAFDVALAGHDMDRRGWQVLSSLAAGPVATQDVVASLAAFDPAPVVRDVVALLVARGWVEEAADGLRLTESGGQARQAAASLVGNVRRRVSQALPGDDYATLVALLARLVAALGPDRPPAQREMTGR